MNATEMLQRIGETLGSTATVKSVFGEPIHAAGKNSGTDCESRLWNSERAAARDRTRKAREAEEA